MRRWLPYMPLVALRSCFRSSYPQIFRYFPSLSQSETLPPTISQLVQSPPFPLSPLPSLPSSLTPLFPLSPLPSLPSSLSPLLPLSPLPSLPSSLSPLFPLSPLPSLPSSISPLSPLSLPFPVSPLPSLIPSLPYAPLPNSSHPSPLSSRPPQVCGEQVCGEQVAGIKKANRISADPQMFVTIPYLPPSISPSCHILPLLCPRDSMVCHHTMFFNHYLFLIPPSPSLGFSSAP
ncbi:unnamed protein product [Closterium sp. NIES-65]|nr:unnamed protein product [Closterium sp. NIES-65]